MVEWRCTNCNRLLGKFDVLPSGSIKCGRCGHMNTQSAKNASPSVPTSVVNRLETKGCSNNRPPSS